MRRRVGTSSAVERLPSVAETEPQIKPGGEGGTAVRASQGVPEVTHASVPDGRKGHGPARSVTRLLQALRRDANVLDMGRPRGDLRKRMGHRSRVRAHWCVKRCWLPR